MIQAKDLTLQRGKKVLFQNANFVIYPKERVGLVGKNGSGKTSLFYLLLGQIEQESGSYDMPSAWRISTVSQTMEQSNQIAREFVIDGDQHLRDLQTMREQCPTSDGHTIAQLEIALNDAGAWTAPSRAEQLMAGLGFTPEQWEQPICSFSGGWQMRLALAKALMAPSDVLLLDEPTNHLDLDAVFWLERWLHSYEGTVVIISHDSAFLNATCNHILHISHQNITKYRGNFDQFMETRAEKLRLSQRLAEQQAEKIAKMQSFINRFKAKATKAKQAQSRIKAIARMEKITPLLAERTVHIDIPSPKQMPDPLMLIDELAIGYTADQPIAKDIELQIRAGDRIGILGVNGAGKSTLVKTIAGLIPKLSGQIKTSKGVSIGYFAQHQLDMLDLNASPLMHLHRLSPKTNEQVFRNYLGRFGFSGDTVNDPITPFSGGEKARLALALIVWSEPNLLLLDEPSNHLDMETRDALAQALSEFSGSVLLVSHDRSLLSTTVDQFWVVHSEKVDLFDGDLKDYQQWIQNQIALSDTPKTLTSESNNDPDIVNKKAQRQQQAILRQAFAKEQKPIQQRIKTIESRIDTIEQQITQFNEQMNDPQFYEDNFREQRVEILAQHGLLSSEKDELETQYMSLLEALEALQKDYQEQGLNI